MKLEPNMYIRTKKGQIYQILEIKDKDIIMNDSHDIFGNGEQFGSTICQEKDILIAKHKIIDLIERHDLIKTTKNEIFEVYAVGSDCVYINKLKEFVTLDNIKSVVTHELFESMEYRI